MPPTKRQHKRTAAGCWTCRRRKIKCDAERPACLKCKKSKLQCEGYGIKLNWVILQGVGSQGEFADIKADPDSGEVVKSENGSTFQRSNIELCRWWLYDYYFQIDQDLDNIDHGATKCGPFRMFQTVSNSTVRKSTAEPAKISPPIVRSDNGNQIMTDFKPRIKQADIFKHLQLIQSFRPEGLLPGISILNDTKTALGTYFINAEVNNTLDSQFEMVYLLSIIVIQLMRLKQDKWVTQKISAFNFQIERFIQMHRTALLSFVSKRSSDSLKVFNKLMILINFKIIINTGLGVSPDGLFLIEREIAIRDEHQTLLSYQYFRFFQHSYQFINRSRYVMPPKYKKYYQDLNAGYNLLSTLSFKPYTSQQSPMALASQIAPTKESTIRKSVPTSRDKDFRIKITSHETPEDQIIRIPRYIDEDEPKDEPNPPSFTVRFGNDDIQKGSIDDELGVGISGNDDHTDDSSEESDEDDNTAFNSYDLFPEFQSIVTTEKSVYGISSLLVYLFEELCHLVNHKRIFSQIGHVSRNWMKVYCDFEDLLVRQVPKVLKKMSNRDLTFRHFLIFCYFKYVRNYPLKYVNAHLNEFRDNSLGIGLIKYVGQSVLSPEKSALMSNSSARVFLSRLGSESLAKFNDWDTTNQEFFVL